MKSLTERYRDYRSRHGVLLAAILAPPTEYVLLGAVIVGAIIGVLL